MTTVKFQTEPLTCPSCISKITTVVERQDGVESAKVMFNSSKVKVTFDADAITPDQIAQSITSLGYQVLSHQQQRDGGR